MHALPVVSNLHLVTDNSSVPTALALWMSETDYPVTIFKVKFGRYLNGKLKKSSQKPGEVRTWCVVSAPP